MRILGLNFGHSAAAVLLEDGRVRSAVEEEKLSRIKGHVAFPYRSIEYVCSKNGVAAKDIDLVAVGCTDLTEFSYGYRQLNRHFRKTALGDKLKGVYYDAIKRAFPTRVDLSKPLTELFYASVEELGFPRQKVRLVDHHDAHAASAFYPSPWRDAAIVTNDGKGDGWCGTYSVGQDGKIRCIDRVRDWNSIGQFYQSVTRYLGYKPNRHEGKITGLAAFGDPSQTLPLLNKVYRYEGGQLRNTFHEIDEFKANPIAYFTRHVDRNDFITTSYLKTMHGGLANFAAVYQMYINYLKDELGTFAPKEIAAGIQQLTEDALVEYIKARLASNFKPRICLAGGVFANVKVNQRIREIPGVENVYVQPAMDDSGTSLGAALSVWLSTGSTLENTPTETVYLGPGYTEDQMAESLRKQGLPFKRLDNPEDELGRMIHEGRIIGRFNGALEWGPRALGNRSIIARPTEKQINDTLNERLKRTEFMPFAPSMLAEDAPSFLIDYSPDHVAARYMTITYNVRPERIDEIQATVHVDGTARPQVVRESENPSFHRIIQAYKKHSGFGVVINTSFNMHEEPIVNSPDDAIRAYVAGAVDVLSLGPFIVTK